MEGLVTFIPLEILFCFFFVFLGSYRIVLDIWQFDMKKKRKKKKFELEEPTRL